MEAGGGWAPPPLPVPVSLPPARPISSVKHLFTKQVTSSERRRLKIESHYGADKCPRGPAIPRSWRRSVPSSFPLFAPPAPPRPAPPAPVGPAVPWILSRTPARPVLWPICPWRDPRLRGPVGGGAERGRGSVSGGLSITPRVPRTLASKETPGSVAPVCPPHPGKPTWRLRWGP